MTVARWENTRTNDAAGTMTYSGGWTDTTDIYTSGGHYHFDLTAGQTIIIHIATASGYTGAVLACMSRSDSPHNVTVEYASGGGAYGAPVTWDQNITGLTGAVNQNYTQYRSLSLPINFVGNGVHDIRITSGTGTSTFDFIDLFTAQTPNAANRYHVFGHSWAYAVLNSNSALRMNNRWSLQIANYLGLTEDNYGVPSEDLNNGNYLATGVAQVTKYWNPLGPYLAGWIRAEMGAAYAPQAHGAAWLADAPNTPQWGSRLPKRAGIMHAVNDAGFEQIYETLGYAIPAPNRNLTGTATIPQVIGPAGTVMKGVVQRHRELISRMLLEVPTIDAIDVFGIGTAFNGGQKRSDYPLGVGSYGPGTNTALYRRWNDALEAMTKETWIPSGKVLWTPLLDDTLQGGGFNVSETDGHPSEHGHYVVFDAWRRQYEARSKQTASAVL